MANDEVILGDGDAFAKNAIVLSPGEVIPTVACLYRSRNIAAAIDRQNKDSLGLCTGGSGPHKEVGTARLNSERLPFLTAAAVTAWGRTEQPLRPSARYIAVLINFQDENSSLSCPFSYKQVRLGQRYRSGTVRITEWGVPCAGTAYASRTRGEGARWSGGAVAVAVELEPPELTIRATTIRGNN